MNTLKIHQCPSCGGNMKIDTERQLYLCPFCGSAFDYEYFNSAQVYEMGERYLSRAEFAAAKDLYQFIITKDPHDFRALRGMMLTAGKFRIIEQVMRNDNYVSFRYDEDIVKQVLENAGNNKEYFDEFAGYYTEMKVLSRLNDKKNELIKEKERLETRIDQECEGRSVYFVKTRSGELVEPDGIHRISLVAMGILAIVIVVLVLVGLISKDGNVIGMAVIIAAFLIPYGIVEFAVVYPRAKALKDLDEHIGTIVDETKQVQTKIDKVEDEIHVRSSKLRIALKGFVKKDKAIMSDNAWK